SSGSPSLPVNGGVSNQLLTISFVPDGTLMTSGTGGNVYSNTFAKFNAKFGSTAAWQNAIITAAQQWAQYANLNFSIVSDNGTPSGQGLYQQGDPGMGDIRVGAYNMTSGQTLGLGYYPPSTNNYSVAGDFAFNSTQNFNLSGANYDLQAVAMHEMGHVLGLGHSILPSAVMFPTYHGALRSLTADDIAGLQAIYGARLPDISAVGLGNNSSLTASLVTPSIDQTSLTAQLSNLDITSTSDVDYYAFVAPVGSNNTLSVNVQSAGLSLLRPSVTVYAADQ